MESAGGRMLINDVHVRVGDVGWIDDLTKPGTVRPHAPGTWILLPARVYQRLRQARVEEVERVLVRREYRGRTYLHAVTMCGRYVGEWAGDVASRHVPERAPAASDGQADRPNRQRGAYVIRRGCGCGGRSTP